MIKLPLSAGIGLINEQTLKLDVLLAPVVIIAGLIGKKIVRHIDQKLFNRIIIVLTIISSAYLLITVN
ncbi:sulfite exporter TauE/SafE domain protein [Propionimicrobium sp. BV2F7]|nr:sulfite exporter TauE/SafE domain protein [Propionimicrobium sp. BV2F7]